MNCCEESKRSCAHRNAQALHGDRQLKRQHTGEAPGLEPERCSQGNGEGPQGPSGLAPVVEPCQDDETRLAAEGQQLDGADASPDAGAGELDVRLNASVMDIMNKAHQTCGS